MTDMVNHPPHYTAGKYEVIDIIKSIVDSQPLSPFEGYMLGNAIKYLARWTHKNGIEDLEKATWYLNKLIEVRGDKNNDNNSD